MMTFRVFEKFFSCPRLKALVLALALTLMLVAAPIRAQDIKSDSPEQRLAFEALNQLMHQNAASFKLDLSEKQDPFLPIKEVLNRNVCGDPWESPSSTPPLLRLDLSAFKLIAITVLGEQGALASFEDGAGASYIVRKGSLIGRNNGRIVEITDSAVIVEESPRGASKPVRTIMRLNETSPFSPQETEKR